MNRLLKLLYGLGLLGLGTILAVLLIKTATSHDTALEEVTETNTAFPNYVEQINSYYKNFMYLHFFHKLRKFQAPYNKYYTNTFRR